MTWFLIGLMLGNANNASIMGGGPAFVEVYYGNCKQPYGLVNAGMIRTIRPDGNRTQVNVIDVSRWVYICKPYSEVKASLTPKAETKKPSKPKS